MNSRFRKSSLIQTRSRNHIEGTKASIYSQHGIQFGVGAPHGPQSPCGTQAHGSQTGGQLGSHTGPQQGSQTGPHGPQGPHGLHGPHGPHGGPQGGHEKQSIPHGLHPLPTVDTRQRFGQTGLLLLPMVTLRKRRAYVDGQQVASGLVRQHDLPWWEKKNII